MTMIPKAIGLFAFLVTPLSASGPSLSGGDLLAIRVGKAETVSHGTLEHVVILIEDGKIVTIGEDLPIERGIPILERPDWTAMPGLVCAHTRVGLERSSSNSFSPALVPTREIYPRRDEWHELLELGVTTLGIVPEGAAGVPGQALAIRPHGDTVAEMIVQKGVYLKVNMSSSAGAKKIVRDAFEKVDKHDEKVTKEREKWEKALEKAKKKKKSRSKKKDDDDEKEDEKDEKTVPKDFVPPEPDPDIQPFIDLREGKLNAMMRISKAGDYLHLLDVMEDEETVNYFLRVPLRTDVDLYEIAEQLGEQEVLLVVSTAVTLQAHTRRERNIPAELIRAGAKIALTPERDRMSYFETWMNDVGHLVSRGMDRDAALAGMTLEGARALGLEERLGSLDAGKDANIVFWNGDPLEPASSVQAVMLEGNFVVEEMD